MDEMKGRIARREIADTLYPLRMYGQTPFVDGAIEEIMDIVEQAMMAVRGKKVPIRLRKYVNPRS